MEKAGRRSGVVWMKKAGKGRNFRVVHQFHSVCSRRNLRLNAGKSKVMVFERREVDFGNPYRMSVPMDERFEIVMGGERMEVVKEFKYLGTVLSKDREMEGEVRERAVKGRSVIGSLARVMKRRSVTWRYRQV